MTTKSTIPSHEYSLKGLPIQVDYKQFSSLNVATVAAISNKNGVDYVMNFDKSVDQTKFIKFLKALRRKYQFEKMALFMDRLSVHRCRQVQ